MTDARKAQILNRVHIYNCDKKEGYIPPYIARARGQLGQVATEIDIPIGELDEFLTTMEKELPPVGD